MKDPEMNNEQLSQEELTDIPNNTDAGDVQAEKLTEPTAEKSWEEKYNELYDTYLRLFSEFDNFRKRSAKERSELIRTAGAEVIKSLLPVVDDFERAKKSMDAAQDIEALKTGMDLVHAKFKKILEDRGLIEVNPVGEPFDAEVHEAITNLPAPSEDQKGKVLDVVEKGYKLNDKIIRYPKVVVYS